MNRPQVCVIHGGTTFDSYDEYRTSLAAYKPSYERLLAGSSWKAWLAEALPDYDILLPQMPNKTNAQYDEWSAYFSNILPYLRPDATLIGHSLGGIFLARYFIEHPPQVPFKRLVLLAAPHSDASDESLGTFMLEHAATLTQTARTIELIYSEDDPVVPLAERDRFCADIPSARVHTFTDKQHFNMETFPELLPIINQDS